MSRDTSLEAFAAIQPSLNAIQRNVYNYVVEQGGRGSTARECENSFIMARSTVSTRFSELEEMGAIVVTGRKRFTTAPYRANVFISVPLGKWVPVSKGKHCRTCGCV